VSNRQCRTSADPVHVIIDDMALPRDWNEKMICTLVHFELYFDSSQNRGSVMKSYTIHGIEKELDEQIQTKASEMGLSLNKTIKHLLNQALGLSKKDREKSRKEFLDLFGTWSDRDVKEFEEKTADFRKIHRADWET
jgi:hypothetical protein